MTFPEALNERRLVLSLDNQGNVLDTASSSSSLFGFKPSLLVGRNLSECVDLLSGLPVTGGAHGLDMEHVLTALVHK